MSHCESGGQCGSFIFPHWHTGSTQLTGLVSHAGCVCVFCVFVCKCQEIGAHVPTVQECCLCCYYLKDPELFILDSSVRQLWRFATAFLFSKERFSLSKGNKQIASWIVLNLNKYHWRHYLTHMIEQSSYWMHSTFKIPGKNLMQSLAMITHSLNTSTWLSNPTLDGTWMARQTCQLFWGIMTSNDVYYLTD